MSDTKIQVAVAAVRYGRLLLVYHTLYVTAAHQFIGIFAIVCKFQQISQLYGLYRCTFLAQLSVRLISYRFNGWELLLGVRLV